jgi:hypothetical protein
MTDTTTGSSSSGSSSSGSTTEPPYVRLLQPQTPTSAFTASSYLRLGSYVSDETGLPTGLKTSQSEVKQGDKGAKSQAEDAKKNEKNDPSKVYTATSQSATSYSTVPKTGPDGKPLDAIVSSNNGILIYTDTDLNENVKGAALQKYGKGHVVEVTTADAKYAVPAGKFDVSALNGIFIKAGTVTATGTVTQAANLEMTAGGYIKQTAYGPLDEITYGETHKNFHGDAYDEFHGFKESIFHGREHTYKMSGVLSLTLAGECVLKLGTKFELTGGVDLGIRLAADLKIFIGLKCDIVLIADIKLVAGYSIKMATSDLKMISGMDVKFATVADMKKVGFNITLCDFDFKKQFIKAESTYGGILKKDLEAKFNNIQGHTSGLISKISGLHSLT